MSLTMQCGVCTKAIKEDAKKVFCFGPCGLVKHLKCSEEIDDAGLKAMESCRGLKYLCFGCRQKQCDFNSVMAKCNEMLEKMNNNFDVMKSVEEKVHTMGLNVVQTVKIELEKQKNAMEKMISDKIAKLATNKKSNKSAATSGPNTRLNKKRRLESGEVFSDEAEMVNDEVVNIESEATGSPSKRPTFADMLKQNSGNSAVKRKKPTGTVVVVRPKENGKTTRETKNMLKANLDRVASHIKTVREGNRGAIILGVQSADVVQSVIESVKEKCGDGFEVAAPKQKRPRLKVLGVGEKLEEKDLLDCLVKQNDVPVKELKIVTCYTTQRAGTQAYNFIVEVDSTAHATLLEMGWVDIDWDNCRIVECLGIIRCFKCCHFGHISTNCSRPQVCSKCAGDHKTADCSSDDVCCVNCDRMNKSRGLNLDTNHCAYSFDCAVYQKHVERNRQHQEE